MSLCWQSVKYHVDLVGQITSFCPCTYVCVWWRGRATWKESKRERERREPAVISSVFTIELLRILNLQWVYDRQQTSMEKIYNWNIKICYSRIKTIYILMVWRNYIVIWQICSVFEVPQIRLFFWFFLRSHYCTWQDKNSNCDLLGCCEEEVK